MSSIDTVHKLALSIMDLVAEYEERNSLIVHIFNICFQIQTAIAPFVGHQFLTFNHNTEHCLYSLAPVLESTHTHLEMWIARREHSLVSVFNPWFLAHQLKENKRQLLQQYITLMTALQVVDRIRGYNFVSPAASILSFQDQEVLHPPRQRRRPTDILTSMYPDSEAKTFWKDHFKGEPSSVDSRRFREALSNWLGRDLDDSAYNRLLLRLDHDHSSTVQFSTFHELVRNGKMVDIVNSYLADPRLPLLIWIDEDVRENTDRVFEATSYGVTVVQLASVPSAKTWIAANHDFLKQNDDPSSIRFIISQTCIDSGELQKPNEDDGSDSMLRYIRDQGFAAPVLISASKKCIHLTRYVEEDRLQMAGSTTLACSVYTESRLAMECANAVYKLCEEIIKFISEHQVLRSDSTTIQISELVSQIEHAVIPVLRRKTINEPLQRCLHDLESVLSVVSKNLHKWNERRSHGKLHISALTYSAWATPKDIKENREFLIWHHAILVKVIQLVIRPKGYNIITPTPSIRNFIEHRSVQKMKMKEDDEIDEPSIFEIDQFWKCSIGSETEFASSQQFCDLLSSWLDEDLSDLARKRLLLRLDEHHTGYISFPTFQFYVRNGRLREDVHLYASDPYLPLLIWIDSDVSAITHQILECTGLGITVIQFASTATVKSWITMNIDFLKKHDSSTKIRFLCNQVLHERDSSHTPADNEEAGGQILSHIRGLDIHAPVLIYTTRSNITATKYVEQYDMAGSLGGNYSIFHSYVVALGKGTTDEGKWMKYDA
ncbi:hypothetical protein CVT25_000085 [Psilocybe cyanescens]|uniref:EF-hand domain-containing protein n=1 Tax=Psilocybe cyanescens TaxID=93625 RepID=A0A409VVT0_PSICY|nr:hypothetical protein CVT25_000085 [Psilocybe cyanescens]